MNNEIKVVFYCRVGNYNPIEINKQENELQEYCKQKGYKIFKKYVDNGYSANDKKRPNYNLMLKDLKQKQFDKIIATERGVLFWNIDDLIEMTDITKKYNCGIELTNENIDTSNQECSAYINMLKAIIQFEKDSRKERYKHSRKNL